MELWVLVVLLCGIAIVNGQQVDRNTRVDCLPHPDVGEAECVSKGCIWDSFYDAANPSVPLCYLPRRTGYLASSVTSKIITLTKDPNSPANPFGMDISPIYFTSNSYGTTLNIKLGPAKRYEPSIKIPRNPSNSDDPLFLEKSDSSGMFSFAVRRKSTYTPIWDTSIGGLLVADKYIQIATYLPSDRIYGFGENIHQTLKHKFNSYTTWGMFARDEPPNSAGNDRKNLYGVHPFYLCLEPGFKAHGVLIWNSNAQEVTTGPGPHLVYRTTGGLLDIFFFPGPEPEQVIQQYLAFIGTPFLPAYFSLGYQLSRYGYKSLDEMKETVKRVQAYGIPLDIPYADIDYMDRYKDFTLGTAWTDFGNYAKQLHNDGLHLFLIFDPAIQVDYDSFRRGIEMNASFIEWERFDQVPHDVQDLYDLTRNTKVMLGVVWPDRHTAFPDFLDTTDKTGKWWTNEFKLYHDKVPFDGIWIDMNEPSNFGTNEDHPWYFDNPDHPHAKPLFCPLSGTDSEYDMPPFQTANVYYFKYGSLSTKTLCMLALTNRGTQRLFNTKNLYGLAESMATQKAIYESTGKRGAIISRSTFPSSGHYGGHWLGDNTARWEDLHTSVIGAQEFNLFGIPYVGSDICGFIGATNEELCLRWQQLGAFHSFSRNHNDNNSPPQDPAQWPSVAAASKQANLFRYHHLPYLFSLHFEASLNGGTVVRPVFFEFPGDINVEDLGLEFMWGSAMIILPVTKPGVTSLSGYLPTEATWYSLRDSDYGQQVASGFTRFKAPTSDLIPVLARGGYIIPRQAPSTTTTASRLNPFELLIPLSFGQSGEPLQASGKFYWDDGESIVTSFDSYNYFHWEIQFAMTAEKAMLDITPVKTASGFAIPTLDIIEVFGYPFYPNLAKAQLNGKSVNINMQTSSYSAFTQILRIESKKLINLATGQKLTLTWPHSQSTLELKEEMK